MIELMRKMRHRNVGITCTKGHETPPIGFTIYKVFYFSTDLISVGAVVIRISEHYRRSFVYIFCVISIYTLVFTRATKLLVLNIERISRN